MEANEYFKEYGLVGSREHLDWMVRVGARSDIHGDFMKDLKRLIKSHELVGRYGTADEAKEYLPMFRMDSYDELKQAIADVESCL